MAYEDDEYVDDSEPEATQPSGGDDDWEPVAAAEPDPEEAAPYQVAGPAMPPPAARQAEEDEDDWELAPSGGFKSAEAAAKPAEDDWEAAPAGGFKPDRGQEPRGLTERITSGFRGGFGEREDPDTHERSIEPLGISPENLEKYPWTKWLQPFAAPADLAMRAPFGAAGAAAGLIAGILEKNPDALLPYGVDRTTADRIQRETNHALQAAQIEAMGRGPKYPAERARAPLPRDEAPALPAEGTAPLPLEGGGTRSPQQGQLPLEPPQDQYRRPQPELPLRTPAGEQGQLPLPGEAAPTPAGRVAPGGELATPPAPELPGPGGRVEIQTEMPLRPPTGREAVPPEPVRQGELLPPAGEQGQLPLPHEEAPTTAGKTERHGTPGATAAAGTAEMQAPPPREPDLTAAKGPEDYGKKTPPREAGSGMNVGEVDPTLAAAIRPAEEAAAARPGEILRGPIPESPAGAQKGGGNIVKPLDARPTGELIQLARRGELSPFMRDSLANELERRGIRRMPEPARAEPPNVGTQPRAREEAARQATQQATAPGPMRQFMQDERGGGRYPFRQLLRDERGGGRITEPPKREPAPAERPGPKLTSFERAKKMTNEQLQAEIARTDIPRVQKAVFSDALRARGEKPNPAAAAKTPTELRQITPTIPTKPGLTERAAKAGISENQQYVRDRIAPPDSIFDKIPRDREGWKEFVHKRYERTVAEFHPAARKAAEIERLLGRPLEKQEDFNRLARSLKGLGGKMESIYREGPFDPETRKVIGPALDPILKKIGDNPKEFEAYAVAKRAIEKGGQGLKTGVDLKRANSVVAELGSRWGQTFKELQTFQSAMLRTAKHLIGEEGIRKIEEANKDYIPWYRAMDPQTQLGDVFATGGGLRVKDPLEKFKGSERQIVSPLDSVLKNTIMLVDLAEKNEALRAMKRADDTFVKAGGKSFMQPSKTGQPFHFSEDMRKRMTDSGIPEDMIERMKFTDAKAFAPDTNRIRLFENGKEKLYDVPSDIARMINGLDRGAVHWAIKVLGKPAQWLRAGATLTPEFATKNIVRDQWTAFIQAQGYKGYIPVYDALYHSVGRIFDPQLRKEFNNWLRNGGANANLMSLDRKMLELDPRSFKDKLANVVTTPSDLKAVLHDLNPITHLRTISEAFENATRFGAHMREVKRGTAAEEAAFRARELTIDFGRMGASPVIRALNSIVPFFNANIQGLDRYGRAIKNDPVPTMLKTLGAITAPSLLLWAYNKDDPRYQELPQWQKMLFWIIPTDNWRNVRPEEEKKLRQNASNAWFRKDPKTGNLQYNDGTLWRVPKPFAEGQLFGSLPERALEAFIQHKPNAWKKVAESIFDTLTPSFIPQAARPVWEQQRNWNDFLGRELMSEFTAKKPQEQQTDRGTTETAKAISGAFRSVLGKEPVGQLGSPIVIDNYIRELTAGLGSLAVKGVGPVGIDPLIRAFQGKEIPPGPERTMADIPGIKAFVTRFPDKGAQSIQDFYDLRKEGQTAKAGGDKNAWIGDDTAKALSGQRQMIDKFMADKDMSPADKRSAIDVTTLMMIDAAKRGIELQGKAEQRQRDIQERKRQRVQ